jgi:hypothetical protein
MSERQKHGFAFEEAVKNILGVTENKSYTDKWDIGDSVSVKFIRENGSVDMGSMPRIVKALLSDTDFTMILGRHKNKVCTEVYELTFTPEVRKALLGQMTLENVEEADQQIKSFSLGLHSEARNYAKSWKALNKNNFGLLTAAPKIDSKSQRRLQCTINNTNLKRLFNLESSDRFSSLVGVSFDK